MDPDDQEVPESQDIMILIFQQYDLPFLALSIRELQF